MGTFPLHFWTGGVLHQEIWEVLSGGGPVCPYFRIGVVGHNFLYSAGVGEPA